MRRRAREVAAKAGLDNFLKGFKDYPLPDKAKLEAAAENSSKCGKCGEAVRAMIEEVDKSHTFAVDLEVLVRLYCRKASCGWTTAQWRPWKRTCPDEL